MCVCGGGEGEGEGGCMYCQGCGVSCDTNLDKSIR